MGVLEWGLGVGEGEDVEGRRNWVGARARYRIERGHGSGASLGWGRSGGGREWVRVQFGGSLGRSEWEMRKI